MGELESRRVLPQRGEKGSQGKGRQVGLRLAEEGRALGAAAFVLPPPRLPRPGGFFRHPRRLRPAPQLAPGPASDSAPPPPVPSSPGRRPGPLPRHEEAVGEEAFPGEGSGGGWRREGAGRVGRPEGGRVTAAGPRGGGAGVALAPPQPGGGRRAGHMGWGSALASDWRAQAPPRAEGQKPPSSPIPSTPGGSGYSLSTQRPPASLPSHPHPALAPVPARHFLGPLLRSLR